MADYRASQRKQISYKISWLIFDQLFISRSLGYDFSKNPTASVLNSTRTTEFKKDSCTRSVSYNIHIIFEFCMNSRKAQYSHGITSGGTNVPTLLYRGLTALYASPLFSKTRWRQRFLQQVSQNKIEQYSQTSFLDNPARIVAFCCVRCPHWQQTNTRMIPICNLRKCNHRLGLPSAPVHCGRGDIYT